MEIVMRKAFVIFTLLMTQYSYTQSDLTVQLTVNGQGKSKDEAKNNALRSANENSFWNVTVEEYSRCESINGFTGISSSNV